MIHLNLTSTIRIVIRRQRRLLLLLLLSNHVAMRVLKDNLFVLLALLTRVVDQADFTGITSSRHGLIHALSCRVSSGTVELQKAS